MTMANKKKRRQPPPKRPDVPTSGTITGFGAARGDMDSCVVKIDGSKAATILETDRVDLGLHLDMPLSSELGASIADRHEFRLARRASLQRIARKSRSTKDIRDFLRQRSHTTTIIDLVIDKLKTIGLLDDQKFADEAANSLARRTPASARFLEHRLRQHGISQDDAALAAKEAAGDPVEAAVKVAQKAMRSLRSCRADLLQQRLHGRLARRGFEYEVIQEAITRTLADWKE